MKSSPVQVFKNRHQAMLDALESLEDQAVNYAGTNSHNDRRRYRKWLATAALEYAAAVRQMAKVRKP